MTFLNFSTSPAVLRRPTHAVEAMIPRFIAERFLYDYLDDGKLLTRLNHVMRRVGLPQLPEHLVEAFPAMRRQVVNRMNELLAGIETS